MSRFQFIFIALLTIFSGTLGGMVSSQIFQRNSYATQKPVELNVRSIHLVDDNGVKRSGLVIENGLPVLYFKGKKGETRAFLGANSDRAMLVFMGENGKPRLQLSNRREGSCSIGILSKRAKPRLFLGHNVGRGSSITFFDENNSGRIAVSVTNKNSTIALTGSGRKPSLALVSSPGEGSMIGMWDQEAVNKIGIGYRHNLPLLYLYQQPRTGLLFNMAGGRPALALMDHGSPIWSATSDVPPAPELPPMDDMMRELTR